MLKFTEGDRVVDEYLGSGEVTRCIKSSLDERHTAAYMVMFDKTPDVRYNMGENPTLVFPSSLTKEV